MLATAGVSSLAPVVALLPGLPVFDSRPFGALGDSHFGFGQKEWAGEEALYRESSVFRYGRPTPRVVLTNRCNTLGRKFDTGPFHGTVARIRIRRSE